MKQLKFMLAAATVIGLATAAQAAAADQFATSTGFEEFEIGVVGKGSMGQESAGQNMSSYFYYDSTEANDSTIVSGSPDKSNENKPTPKGANYFTETQAGNAKVLNVNTGTDPLLRTMNPVTGDTMPSAVKLTADTYVDTLVQFTVTPSTDTVTATEDDKLMIYLKEAKDKSATNLVVQAGYLDYNDEDGPIFSSREYVNESLELSTGVWYRLTVKLHKNVAFPGIPDEAEAFGGNIQAFSVYIDNDIVRFAPTYNTSAEGIETILNIEKYENELEGTMLLSLKANEEGDDDSLLAVGFAGEGYVDDLIVTTEDPFTPISTGIDFTLALGTGVSAVTYTIAGGAPITVTANADIKDDTASAITITAIDYVFGYTAGNYGIGDYSDDVTIDANAINFSDGTAGDKTTASDLGIKTGAFADATAGSQELLDLMTWATAKGATISMINAMSFNNGNPPAVSTADNVVPEEAYLLNCDLTFAAIEKAKEDFVLTADDLTKLMANPANPGELSVDNKYNGTLVIEGATTLSDPSNNKPNWGTNHAEPKFYRARLTK